jgi:GTP-sensing pleiotropic transcriptional regulator CodY
MRTITLPFPLDRRHDLVTRLAAQMLARSPSDANKHLVVELERHRRILRRRGFADSVIAAQIRALESAVRAELWRVVICPQQPNTRRR